MVAVQVPGPVVRYAAIVVRKRIVRVELNRTSVVQNRQLTITDFVVRKPSVENCFEMVTIACQTET